MNVCMYGCVINRPAQVNHTVRSVHGAGRKRRKIIAALKRKFLMNLCVCTCVCMGMANEAPSIEFHAPFVPHWSEVPGYMGTPAPPAIHTYIHTYTVKENGDSNTHCSMSKPSSVHALFPLESNPPNKYVCMYVFMYVCMYVYMSLCICIEYACMYVCIYMHVYMNMNE